MDIVKFFVNHQPQTEQTDEQSDLYKRFYQQTKQSEQSDLYKQFYQQLWKDYKLKKADIIKWTYAGFLMLMSII